MFKLIAFGLLIGLTLLTGCQPSGIASEKIEGRWVIVGADRGNGATEAMNGMYFIFGADQNMTTNFTEMGEEATYPFELGTGDTGPLTQKSEEPLIYNITSVADTAMTMSTSWKGTDFTFELRKRTLQNVKTTEQDSPVSEQADTTTAIAPAEPQ